jgi:hypothetical protein
MLRLWGNSRAEVGAHGTGHRAAGDEPPHGAMVAAPRKGDSLGWMRVITMPAAASGGPRSSERSSGSAKESGTMEMELLCMSSALTSAFWVGTRH